MIITKTELTSISGVTDTIADEIMSVAKTWKQLADKDPQLLIDAFDLDEKLAKKVVARAKIKDSDISAPAQGEVKGSPQAGMTSGNALADAINNLAKSNINYSKYTMLQRLELLASDPANTEFRGLVEEKMVELGFNPGYRLFPKKDNKLDPQGANSYIEFLKKGGTPQRTWNKARLYALADLLGEKDLAHPLTLELLPPDSPWRTHIAKLPLVHLGIVERTLRTNDESVLLSELDQQVPNRHRWAPLEERWAEISSDDNDDPQDQAVVARVKARMYFRPF